MQISIKAYAKINWLLDILALRSDGYHELDMLMQTIELHDELRFAPGAFISLAVDGHPSPIGNKNLVVRAANALRAHAGIREGARITLYKRIPVRAGLGGGSADCAATLIALNRLWKVNLSMETLMEIGATLGADVPFCIQTGFVRVRGIGEKMESREVPPFVWLVILHPGNGLSTASVFSEWDAGKYPLLRLDVERASEALQAGDYETLKAVGGNALEAPAIKLLPEVASAKQALTHHGARFSQMTGSGSAVFGVFLSEAEAKSAADAIGDGAIVTRTAGRVLW